MSKVFAIVSHSKSGQIHTVTISHIDMLRSVLKRDEEDMAADTIQTVKFNESLNKKVSFLQVKRDRLIDFPFIRLAIDKGNFKDEHF